MVAEPDYVLQSILQTDSRSQFPFVERDRETSLTQGSAHVLVAHYLMASCQGPRTKVAARTRRFQAAESLVDDADSPSQNFRVNLAVQPARLSGNLQKRA